MKQYDIEAWEATSTGAGMTSGEAESFEGTGSDDSTGGIGSSTGALNAASVKPIRRKGLVTFTVRRPV